jgi:hypothetical protein
MKMHKTHDDGIAGIVTMIIVLTALALLSWWYAAQRSANSPIVPNTVKTASDLAALSKRFSPAPPDPAIVALANAARKYDVDPAYLLAISRFETATEFSPLVEPGCKNCSAQGLCQMIRATRKAYGVKYVRYKSGPYISWLITKAQEQADACARFTRKHIVAISKAVGRKPTYGDLYACHIFGLDGGLRIMRAKGSTLTRRVVSKGAWKNNKFIRKARTVRDLRVAFSMMIRRQMRRIKVPSEQACRAPLR